MLKPPSVCLADRPGDLSRRSPELSGGQSGPPWWAEVTPVVEGGGREVMALASLFAVLFLCFSFSSVFLRSFVFLAFLLFSDLSSLWLLGFYPMDVKASLTALLYLLWLSLSVSVLLGLKLET